jgi:hypothetical protein
MKKIQFIVYGVWYTVTALWPLIKKFYEDTVVAAAVITAELEDALNSGDFRNLVNAYGKQTAKKNLAKKVLKHSIFSPVTKKTDEVIGDLIETGWDMLFNKGRK